MNLEKRIEKGTLKWIGNNFPSVCPLKMVIAGKSIKDISNALNCSSYQIGRVNVQNAFIAFNGNSVFYLFVNPRYKSYRKLFERVIGIIPLGYQVDHVLSKNLATHFNYKYVALCIIPAIVNIKHGNIEKKRMEINSINQLPNICYSDTRIFDKILSRNPYSRRAKHEINAAYNPKSLCNYGLTLKQKGIWNAAFGLERIEKEKLIKLLKPLTIGE